MDATLGTAVTALVMGMGTVFVGLALLQMAMYLSSWAFNRSGRQAAPRDPVLPAAAAAGPAAASTRAGLSIGTPVQPTEPTLRAVDGEGRPVTGALLAAMALALHLADHEQAELEEQRLTWTRMFKPFSPWMMDGKTSLHTRRVRWRANAGAGRIQSSRHGL